jgi:ABC-type Zn2+ transport system substrate-binding protein/surface adhesin
MKALTLIVSSLTLLIGFSSCEKHDWEDTKKLYETHDDHGHGDHGHDDHGHGKDAGHKDDAHKSDAAH